MALCFVTTAQSSHGGTVFVNIFHSGPSPMKKLLKNEMVPKECIEHCQAI